MATFVDVVLRQSEIASMVFEFQFGVYEDVLSRFVAFHHLVDFLPTQGANNGLYVLDPAFHTPLRAEPDTADPKWLRTEELWLNNLNTRDERFPLHLAIAEGDLEASTRILRCRKDLAFQDVFAVAAIYGHCDILSHLLELRTHSNNILAYKYEDGYYRRRPKSLDAWLPRHVLAKDNAIVLRLLWDHRRDAWSHDLLQVAAEMQAAQATVFLYERMPDAIYAGFMNDAAKLGLLAIVQDLHSRGEACTTDAMDGAAANGHLEVVRFLHLNRDEGCTTSAMNTAIANGHLDVVRFLYEQCHQVAPLNALDTAAANGDLALLMYLHGLGPTGATTAAVDNAVANGHLDVVCFLLAHRSEGGSRDVMVQSAIEGGWNDVALYLVSAGYPLPPQGDIALGLCLTKPNALAVIQLLVDRKRPFTANMLAIVRAEASDDVFELVETYVPVTPWTYATVQSALQHERMDRLGAVFSRQPALRADALLDLALRKKLTTALCFLLDAGVGSARDAAVNRIMYHHLDILKRLLPYCLHHDEPIDNLVFLVEWYVQRAMHFTQSALLVLKAEIVRQATAAHCLLSQYDVGLEVTTLAAALLARGATTSHLVQRDYRPVERVLFTSGVADWGLATLVVHFWSTDAAHQTVRLSQWVEWVQNAEMKTHLQRLLRS